MESNKEKSIVLDGSDEQQKKEVETWLDSFTEEENAQAMSDEFAYLDED